MSKRGLVPPIAAALLATGVSITDGFSAEENSRLLACKVSDVKNLAGEAFRSSICGDIANRISASIIASEDMETRETGDANRWLCLLDIRVENAHEMHVSIESGTIAEWSNGTQTQHPDIQISVSDATLEKAAADQLARSLKMSILP